MRKEIASIKFGSYSGYKVYETKHDIVVWKIGADEIKIPKEIALGVFTALYEEVKKHNG